MARRAQENLEVTLVEETASSLASLDGSFPQAKIADLARARATDELRAKDEVCNGTRWNHPCHSIVDRTHPTTFFVYRPVLKTRSSPSQVERLNWKAERAREELEDERSRYEGRCSKKLKYL